MRNCRGHSPRRAYTLIEALVTMGIFLSGLLLIGNLMDFGVHSFRRQSARSDTQRDLLIATSRLAEALRQSCLGSVGFYYPSGSANNGDLNLSFAVPQDAMGTYQRDPQGLPLYSSYAFYYCRPAHTDLWFTMIPLAPPSITSPPPLTPAQMATAVGSNPGRCLMEGLLGWQALDLESPLQLSSPITALRLRFSVRTTRGEAFDLSLPVRFLR